MHILLITTYFEPDQGSTAIQLTQLAKRLHERGHQLTVLTTLPHYPQGQILDSYRGKLTVVEDRDGLRVIQTWLWATASPRISRKLVSQVTFMLTTSLRGLAIPRPDIIFIEAQPVFTSLAGVFLSHWKRTPYVLDVSDLWPDHLLSVGAITEAHPVYRIARRTVDTIYQGAAAIVVLHDGLAHGIQTHVSVGNKIHTIYVGTDLKRFYPGQDTSAFRRKYGLGEGKLVTFIGTFATPYDFETMFDVVKHFIARPEIRFVFIGSGSQSEFVKARLTQGDLPNLSLLGWIDHVEIPLAWAASCVTYWALHDHDLYRGTFPAKSYEAMACGTPIAAAMEGVGADVIARSGGGITVPFGDAVGLATAVECLLDDAELRDQYSRAARAYAEEHFDYEKSVIAYEEVLLKAVKR